ncbi:DUF192 domain-containing protein [Hyphomonas sp.]|jgi:uncharacterized membrane protein (UPF0127 family)|uniref:DUF192 domain-containing protein n=1 Tax=Hyphomonas sp. TaxID=87 RepID=UPI0025B9C619|nr:DUF192 domain-containing protein [Hyphomonas sp.]MEE2921645.1 DUF192 domain-containing protein [Pseudomonadota bacterium]
MLRSIVLALASLIVFLPAAFAQLETGPLTVTSGDTEHRFTVELANDPEEVQTGLMNREELGPDAGMLFDFGQPREANMWMKNTLIPLDMLFIDTDGEVLAIARDAVPGSLRRINPGFPVKAVLELAGGRAEELGIEPGDTVHHEIFGNLGE